VLKVRSGTPSPRGEVTFMNNKALSRDQLKRLQVLWAQYARRELIKNSREERLSWANEQLRHAKSGRLNGIQSFNDLSRSEASDLINLLQSQMGVAETSPAKSRRPLRSSIRNRDQAKAAGTEGRRGSRSKLTIADAEDLAMIDSQLTAMQWTRERLDALLASPSSPLGSKRSSNPVLRTVGDVNRVLWALKGIARRTDVHQVAK
jgi:hypothetical protein